MLFQSKTFGHLREGLSNEERGVSVPPLTAMQLVPLDLSTLTLHKVHKEKRL